MTVRYVINLTVFDNDIGLILETLRDLSTYEVKGKTYLRQIKHHEI
jgi:hypothetical protein